MCPINQLNNSHWLQPSHNVCQSDTLPHMPTPTQSTNSANPGTTESSTLSNANALQLALQHPLRPPSGKPLTPEAPGFFTASAPLTTDIVDLISGPNQSVAWVHREHRWPDEMQDTDASFYDSSCSNSSRTLDSEPEAQLRAAWVRRLRRNSKGGGTQFRGGALSTGSFTRSLHTVHEGGALGEQAMDTSVSDSALLAPFMGGGFHHMNRSMRLSSSPGKGNNSSTAHSSGGNPLQASSVMSVWAPARLNAGMPSRPARMRLPANTEQVKASVSRGRESALGDKDTRGGGAISPGDSVRAWALGSVAGDGSKPNDGGFSSELLPETDYEAMLDTALRKRSRPAALHSRPSGSHNLLLPSGTSSSAGRAGSSTSPRQPWNSSAHGHPSQNADHPKAVSAGLASSAPLPDTLRSRGSTASWFTAQTATAVSISVPRTASRSSHNPPPPSQKESIECVWASLSPSAARRTQSASSYAATARVSPRVPWQTSTSFSGTSSRTTYPSSTSKTRVPATSLGPPRPPFNPTSSQSVYASSSNPLPVSSVQASSSSQPPTLQFALPDVCPCTTLSVVDAKLWTAESSPGTPYTEPYASLLPSVPL